MSFRFIISVFIVTQIAQMTQIITVGYGLILISPIASRSLIGVILRNLLNALAVRSQESAKSSKSVVENELTNSQ
jgi:hypothetical protein